MIKALIFFAALLAIAFGASWLADIPGEITVDLPALGLRLEDISLLVGLLGILTLMATTIAGWIILKSIWQSPRMVGGFFSSRRRDKGYKALSTGMIAVGVGDLALAQRQATKARKLIGQEPMTLMLEAQTAQLAGNSTKARQSFEAMLDLDETRGLGRRGLYIEAQRRGDADEAMEMAKAAVGDGRKTSGWAGSALLDMQTASEDWQGALVTLSQNQANKQITKEQFRRQRAVILTAQAIELDGKESSAADMRRLLLEACKLAPGLVPAAAKAGEVLNGLNEYRKANKIIEAAWRLSPHPDLAAVYATIKTGDTALDRLKRIRSLYGLMPDHVESKLALATAAIDAREYAEARTLLEPLAEEHLTPRICMLMAELEEGENSDFGKVRQWLARAVGAHRDPVWVADGQVSDIWQPTSPVTGKLDIFEWKVPVRELANISQPVIESDEALDEAGASEEDVVLLPPSDDAEPADMKMVNEVVAKEDEVDKAEVVQEIAQEGSEPEVVSEVVADVKDVKEVTGEPAEKDDETTSDVAPLVEDDSAKELQDGEDVPSEAAESDDETEDGKPREVEFALPHAPDDPGPKGDPVPPTPEKRFRLF